MPELNSFRDGTRISLVGSPEELAGGSLTAGGRSCELSHRRLTSTRQAQELVERLRVAASVPGALTLPPEAAAAEGSEVVCAFRARRGADLRSVLRLVPLTLEQAALLGDGLLAALAALHRRGVVQDRLDAERLLLGPDGRLRLVEPGLWAPLEAHPPGRDLERAGRLLERILGSVTGAARRDGSELSQLRSVAEGLGTAQGAAAAGFSLAAWRSALPLDPRRRQRVRSQLGALGASLPQSRPATPRSSSAPSALGQEESSAPELPAGAAAMPLGSAPTGRPPAHIPPFAAPAGRALRRSRTLAVVGAAVVLVSLGVLAARLGGLPASSAPTPRAPASTPAPSVSSSPSAGPSPTATPPPTTAPPGEIPLLGPPSAPPVRQVALTASCPPGGGPCQFNVTAQLGAHPSDSVRWELDEVNRCTGDVATVASGVVSAPAFYTYVEAQPTVTVPASGAVAMIALAGAGGLAASPPLSLGPAPASCPS